VALDDGAGGLEWHWMMEREDLSGSGWREIAINGAP